MKLIVAGQVANVCKVCVCVVWYGTLESLSLAMVAQHENRLSKPDKIVVGLDYRSLVAMCGRFPITF